MTTLEANRTSNPLQGLGGAGQSVWLDFLKRSFIQNDLARMIETDGVKGVTSNPSIFEQAIADSDEYSGAIKDFTAHGAPTIAQTYEHLVIADIKAAADVLYSVYEATSGRDGYVSLECSPYLANDTEATIADPQVLSFIPRIKVFVDDGIEGMGAAFRHAARVAVHTTDGRTIKREVLNRRGSPENAVSREDVERKFAANLAGLLEAGDIDRLKTLALTLDTLPNADDILRLIAPAR